MQFDTVLFDLDGTLTDSADGIINSASYALKKMNKPVPDRKTLEKFIGPPLMDSFVDISLLDRESAVEAIRIYREYYAQKGIFECKPYPGIENMLQKLKKAGKKVAMATSKPTIYATRIVKHFNIEHCFDFIGGSELDGTRTDKKEVIQYVIDHLCPAPSEKIAMVGDRRYDMFGALGCGICPVGVTYGYGSRAELEGAGAQFIARDTAELESILLGDFQ